MRGVWFGLVILILTGVARGDQDVKPEQLQKMYNDTLAQLKEAQDRKAALARENAALAAKVADLEKQIKTASDNLKEVKDRYELNIEQTEALRARGAAWAQFLGDNPLVRAQWLWFVDDVSSFGHPGWKSLFDLNWPFSAIR